MDKSVDKVIKEMEKLEGLVMSGESGDEKLDDAIREYNKKRARPLENPLIKKLY